MKELIDKKAKILRGKKGETFVESLCSIVVFSILMLSITLMVNSAVQVVNRSVAYGKKSQDNLNSMALGQFTTAPLQGESITIGGLHTPVIIAVNRYTENTITAFVPKP